MHRFCLGCLGGLQGGFQGHYHGWSCFVACLLLFPPFLPPSHILGKHTFHTLVFFRDVLTGAWEVDCGSVAMVTSLAPRHLLSNK